MIQEFKHFSFLRIHPILAKCGELLDTGLNSSANSLRYLQIDGLHMHEIKNRFIALMSSPNRWVWLTTLIATPVLAGVAIMFIVSTINDAYLARAVQARDIDMVSTMLKNGGNANGTLSQGFTYFDYAVKVGDVQLASVLLDHGVDPNATEIDGSYPLTRAIEGNQQGVAQLILKRGAEIPKTASGAPNLLHKAAENGDIVTVKLLLDRGADVNAPFPNGMLLIEYAVRNAWAELVSTLIDRGANPNLVAQEGQPLLALAVALDLPDVVGALVDHGADINAILITPVSDEFVNLFASQYARFYLTKDSGLTPLMLAVLRKRQDTVRTLLARKARTNTPTKKHGTWPIGFAAARKDVEMMQILLGRDPDPAKQERHIVVSLPKQTATLYVNGNVALKTRVSTGRKGFATPAGKYVITDKNRNWISTIYKVPMPYFLRLSGSSIGLHQGVVPNRPASHGCIRVPSGNAARIFALAKVGDLVTISAQ